MYDSVLVNKTSTLGSFTRALTPKDDYSWCHLMALLKTLVCN